MDREEFLNATTEKFSQVYKGKSDSCRCGCAGTYTATSFTKYPRANVNDKRVSKLLAEAQELVREGAPVEFGINYVDVTAGVYANGEDKALTFYFDNVN